MKRSLSCLVSMLCASLALAEPPAPTTETRSPVSELVDAQLLAPLRKVESKRARFSRAAPVVTQRRVRVLDAAALTDIRGRAFVRFAIDERRSRDARGAWKKDSVVGCAYLNERELFVRRGQAYVRADSLLGEDAEERQDVCRAAPVSTAHATTRTSPGHTSATKT